MGRCTVTQGNLLTSYVLCSCPFQSLSCFVSICDVCCSYINAQGMPALDLQQDASLVNVYLLPSTSYVYVSFARPLETSDDVDLDYPWYLYYAYGPFDSTSTTGPVGDPGSNLWVSAERIQFDCERKNTLHTCSDIVCVVYIVCYDEKWLCIHTHMQ